MFSHPPRCHDEEWQPNSDGTTGYVLRPGGWCSQAQQRFISGTLLASEPDEPAPLPGGGVRMPEGDLHAHALDDIVTPPAPKPRRVVTFTVTGQTLEELDTAAQERLGQLLGLARTQLGAVPYDIEVDRYENRSAVGTIQTWYWRGTVTAHLPGSA